MVRMIMHGCCGAMGRTITELVKEQEDVVIVAGVDLCGGEEKGYPVYKTLEEVQEEGSGLRGVFHTFAPSLSCFFFFSFFTLTYPNGRG